MFVMWCDERCWNGIRPFFSEGQGYHENYKKWERLKTLHKETGY